MGKEERKWYFNHVTENLYFRSNIYTRLTWIIATPFCDTILETLNIWKKKKPIFAKWTSSIYSQMEVGHFHKR